MSNPVVILTDPAVGNVEVIFTAARTDHDIHFTCLASLDWSPVVGWLVRDENFPVAISFQNIRHFTLYSSQLLILGQLICLSKAISFKSCITARDPYWRNLSGGS